MVDEGELVMFQPSATRHQTTPSLIPQKQKSHLDPSWAANGEQREERKLAAPYRSRSIKLRYRAKLSPELFYKVSSISSGSSQLRSYCS